MPVKPTPAIDRIMARVEKEPEGCWVWTGAVNHGGYGIVQLGRGIGTDRVHRVVYEHLVEPIPNGLTIDHLCGIPACCNPAHLDVVTRAENARRQGERRTHCKHGHEFTPQNTYTRPDTHTRSCRTCANKRRSHEAQQDS